MGVALARTGFWPLSPGTADNSGPFALSMRVPDGKIFVTTADLSPRGEHLGAHRSKGRRTHSFKPTQAAGAEPGWLYVERRGLVERWQ
jgi:hypothetical protein